MPVPKSFQLNPGQIFGGRFYWGSMKKKSIKAKWCFIKHKPSPHVFKFYLEILCNMKIIFQQMEAIGVLPDTDDYK